MTNQSQTEQLRDKMEKVLARLQRGVWEQTQQESNKELEKSINKAMSLILADRERHIREARKQELVKVYGLFGAPKQHRTNITTDFTSYVDNRIAELSNTKETQ